MTDLQQTILTYVGLLERGAFENEGYPLLDLLAIPWTIQPFFTAAVQTDMVSSGLWVLAQMFSVFRGYRRVGVGNRNIARFFRGYIYYLLLQLPPLIERGPHEPQRARLHNMNSNGGGVASVEQEGLDWSGAPNEVSNSEM